MSVLLVIEELQKVNKSFFIFYVKNKDISSEFYTHTLGVEPILNVPGITEFELTSSSYLGLMTAVNMNSLLDNAFPESGLGDGIPRAELYLNLENPEEYHRRALEAGATELSPMLPRDWGDIAAYSMDLDGHVLAFAKT